MSSPTRARIAGSLLSVLLGAAALAAPAAAAGSQTISFSLPTVALGGTRPTPVALTGRASSGLPVTYEVATPATCVVSGTSLTPLAAGTCTVTASQAGDELWTPAEPVTRTMAVITTSIRVGFDQSFTVGGELRLSVPLVVRARTLVTMSVSTGEPLMAGRTVEVWGRYAPRSRWTRLTVRAIDRTTLTSTYRFLARPWAQYRWRWAGNGVLHDAWSQYRTVIGL